MNVLFFDTRSLMFSNDDDLFDEDPIPRNDSFHSNNNSSSGRYKDYRDSDEDFTSIERTHTTTTEKYTTGKSTLT